MKRIICLTGVLVLTLMIAAPAAADDPTIGVRPEDNPLVIEGTLTGATSSFSGNVRITLRDVDATELQLLPDDLTHDQDSDYDIDRSNISISNNLSLVAGQPRDVRITVNNVTRPGVYTTDLIFKLPDQPEEEWFTLPLELHIDAAPNVTPVDTSRTIQVVRCQNAFSCWIAGWLLPAGMTDDEWTVQLENKTLLPVRVTDYALVMRGDTTHRVLLPTDLEIDTPFDLSANDVEDVSLEIARTELPADRYHGTVRFDLAGTDTPVSLNLDLSVRHGPGWPLVVVVLGILGGRLLRRLEKPGEQERRALVPPYSILVEKVRDDIKNPYAKMEMGKKLDDWKRRLDADEDPATLRQDLDKLELQIEAMISLDELEARGDHEESFRLPDVKDLLTKARKAVVDGNIEQANQLREQVEKKFDAVPPDPEMSGVVELMSDSLRRAGDMLQRWDERRVSDEREDKWRQSWLLKIIRFLSGAPTIRTEVEWVLWQLLSLVLLFALVLVGLKSLYVTSGATFGANAVYDYFGLFLWGFSSDVATKTLQNLTA